MSALGAFTFVLHCHHPFMRLGGRWTHGEEWIHEAILDTYLPLLATLHDLSEDGIGFRLTVGLSPILAEQLADPSVLEHFERFLDERLEAAQKDMLYFENEAYNEHLRFLAEWYRDSFQRLKTAFVSHFNRDLIGAFRRLQDDGLIEIITTAATHAYLPLLARDGSLNAQVKTAAASYKRLFGKAPTGFWLPEYGYRPAQITETGRLRPGLEHFLADNGFKSFFVDSHAFTGDAPRSIAAGDVIGVYGAVKKRYALPATDVFAEARRDVSAFAPYFVAEAGAAPLTNIAVMARNERVGQQVWGNELGYPLDFDYREPGRRAGTSGFPYWRVTGQKVDAHNKDYYHPDWAAYKIEQHAEHFAHLIGDQLRSHHSATGSYGAVMASFDADLFGHWWFEGIQWLGYVLRHLAHSPDIDLLTISPFVEAHPPTGALDLRESSWGLGGLHFLWDNQETRWMWTGIHEAEDRMSRLAERYDAPTHDEAIVLAQAARELLLLQSSDWPFLVSAGGARAYAVRRFSEHADRFDHLAESLETGVPDTIAAQRWWQQDNVFPDVDYRWFSEKQD